jgi:hypothetical protein
MCGFNPGAQKKVYQLTKKFTDFAMMDDGLKVIATLALDLVARGRCR